MSMKASRLLFSLLMVSPKGIISPYLPYLKNTSVYGAFSNDKNYTINFTLVGSFDVLSFTASYYNNRTNARLAVDTRDLYDSSFSYELRTKNKMNNDGLRVEFTLDNGLDTGTQTIILYPTNPTDVYSYLYKDNYFYSNNTVFKLTSRNNVRNYERMIFRDTVDYITNSIDNSLDLSEISFSYDDGNELPNMSVNKYLRFRDEYNLFPYISAEANSYKQIPLKCLQSGETISFEYKNVMYYDPASLQMSLTNREGYQSTTNFYLPKTSITQLETYDFEIYMPSFGRSLNNVHIPLQFYKDKNFAGLCTNSNYCIKGGLKE